MVSTIGAIPVGVLLGDMSERRAHDVASGVLCTHPVLVPPRIHLRKGDCLASPNSAARCMPCRKPMTAVLTPQHTVHHHCSR